MHFVFLIVLLTVILMVIDNFDVQVQIILLFHHCCHLLMMIMRLELVVNHLKCNKKEKRKLRVALRSACKTVHILLWNAFGETLCTLTIIYARSKVMIGYFRFLLIQLY